MQQWLSQLMDTLKADAAVLTRRACQSEAMLLLSIVEEIECLHRSYLTQSMTLAEAAEYCQRDKRTLERWVADGDLHNVGEPGAPRVLVCELPTPIRRAEGWVLNGHSLAKQANGVGGRAPMKRLDNGKASRRAPMERTPLKRAS